jgi:hypothetical protein
MKPNIALLTVASLILSGAAAAGSEGVASEAAAPQAAHHDDHAGHHYYPNHVAVFGAGLTSNLGHSSHTYTLGADYERRFGAFGVGGLVESVFASHRETIVAGLLTLHPWEGLKVFAGAGQLSEDDHSNFLKRIGAGYDFHFGRASLTPSLSLDLVHGEELLVYGVSFGLGF